MKIGARYLRFIDGQQVAFHRKVMVAVYVRADKDLLIFDVGRKFVYCSGGDYKELS